MIKVKKRNGEIVEFNQGKIFNAIKKAADSVGKDNVAEKILTYVMREITRNRKKSPEEPIIIDVEEIQDIIEDKLITSENVEIAKAYILYREQHRKLRKIKVECATDKIDQYLTTNDWKIKENSNMTFSLQGLNNYISSNITSKYWLENVYPPEIRKAHEEGFIHIHDLGSLSPYCVGWDLMDILKTGFRGVSGKIESNPPRHFRSALGQITNFFYTLQGEAAGAQALSNFDTLLAPFVYFDDLSYTQIKQALQEFLFNINIPTRVGFQTPFTNITMDLKCPSILADVPVLIGGNKIYNFMYNYLPSKDAYLYKHFQSSMDDINKAFAEVMMEGDAHGRPFTFPIPTYNITKDFDWNSEFLEPIWKMTGKYGIPYFSNFINSDMSPEDTRSMCCRLRLDTRELHKRGGGLFGSNPLTGSIGVVTINLPLIGYTNKGDDIYITLNHAINLAIKSLEIKRKVLEKLTEDNLYPYSKFYLRDIKEKTGKYWTNHFSTIGIIGMNEFLINYMNVDIGPYEGRRFAIDIMNIIREKLLHAQEETGNIYNLEATPAEGCSYRLAKLNKERYSLIMTAGDKTPFYTNSTQPPVNYTDDIYEMLEHQDELQTLYTGGTVLHLYLGEAIDNGQSIKELIQKIFTKYKLPYLTLTPTFSICPSCGYLSGEHPTCPHCDAETEVYSRVCGYLRPVKQWNAGKQEEFNLRKSFKVNSCTQI